MFYNNLLVIVNYEIFDMFLYCKEYYIQHKNCPGKIIKDNRNKS